MSKLGNIAIGFILGVGSLISAAFTFDKYNTATDEQEQGYLNDAKETNEGEI